MKIEQIDQVGDLKTHWVYTFDAEKETDMRAIREFLYKTVLCTREAGITSDDIDK